MTMKKIASALVTVALLGSVVSACASRTVTGEPLSGEQVRTLISGNTVSGPIYAKPYDFSYMPGGRVYGEIGSDTGNGSWRITDDGRYCHEWSNFFDATENCYKWYDVGGGRYRMVNVDSYRRWDIEVWRIKPGLD
jgi:hypothetical protein